MTAIVDNNFQELRQEAHYSKFCKLCICHAVPSGRSGHEVKEEHLWFRCMVPEDLYDFVPISMISVPCLDKFGNLSLIVLLLQNFLVLKQMGKRN